ncbi:MAG: hypothetical protein RJA14_545 [Pseudomonadota bacterium]|jgi:peroxiredoxin (alkyl hydroperoxide reductase subunit C)
MPDAEPAFTVRPLRLHDVAPNFSARTTMGHRSLSDYRGRWLVLFSHPADFTPVCTSEFIAFARMNEAFVEAGCDLLALSVDSLYSHIAWIKDINDQFGVEVAFPILEDPSMVIGRAYGMVDETSNDSATVRATYIIDPEGLIRAISWYPMNVGRSVEELLRLVSALQTADREICSTPEGWRPGGPLLESAAVTVEQALADSRANTAWYFRERQT